eukprot:1593122-Pleurochrysis_carterae.AAC.1
MWVSIYNSKSPYIIACYISIADTVRASSVASSYCRRAARMPRAPRARSVRNRRLHSAHARHTSAQALRPRRKLQGASQCRARLSSTGVHFLARGLSHLVTSMHGCEISSSSE